MADRNDLHRLRIVVCGVARMGFVDGRIAWNQSKPPENKKAVFKILYAYVSDSGLAV
jgi:hypothetical protein